MPFNDQTIDELTLLQNERIKRVVLAAREEFIEQGIMNSKIKNIAKRAHVGEASVYRYFTDKNELVKLVAFQYWHEMFQVFRQFMEERETSNSTSIDRIRAFLEIFKLLYTDYPSFLIFTEDFDGYMQYVINDDKTANFKLMIDNIKEYFLKTIKEGILNSEIRDNLDLDYVYSFVSQTMAATSQKLVSRVGYLHKADDGYGIRCIEDLINMFIKYIQKDYANA